MKRLYRSNDNKVLAGVCGGIGEYTDVDPTVIRLVYVLVTAVTVVVPCVLAYIVLAIIIPKEREVHRG